MAEETQEPPASDREPVDPPLEAPDQEGGCGRIVRGVVGALLAIVVIAGARIAYEFATLPDPATLADAGPASTAFIDRYRQRLRDEPELPPLDWRPVPGDSIAATLRWAVIVAEDIEFFSHSGFSHSEIRRALRDALSGGRRRGASTITQQLAKNLWLSPSRNPLRKLKEAALTRRLEERLSKRRILELYLNVVEFGPGVYGAQAAALHYFDKPATALTADEAAALAASLPRPASWHPGNDSPGYLRYVEEIRGRMRRATFLERQLPPIEPSAPSEPASVDSVGRPPQGPTAATDSVPRP